LLHPSPKRQKRSSKPLQREKYLAKEQEIEQAIEAAPDPTTFADARGRAHR